MVSLSGDVVVRVVNLDYFFWVGFVIRGIEMEVGMGEVSVYISKSGSVCVSGGRLKEEWIRILDFNFYKYGVIG